MKRCICGLLVVLQILLLCACNQGETSNTTNNQTDAQTESVEQNTIDTITIPQESTNDNLDLFVATNEGEALEHSIADGDVYMIDISNSDAAMSWSVNIIVNNGFDIDDLKYIGCCNGYLEPVNAEISCELVETKLTIKAKEKMPASEEVLYLVLVSDQITEGDYVLYKPHAGDDMNGSELRKIRKMTGDVVYSTGIGEFSDGLSWCTLTYADTKQSIKAVIDTTGRVVGKIKDTGIVSYGDFYNGVSLVENTDGILKYLNANGDVVFSSDNSDYKEQIKGMYPGGYIFLERTEANLTSNTKYYAIMDCYKNFVIDWTAYGDYCLFNYLGGGIFAFLDGFDRGDDDNVKFYNAETKVWTTVNNIDGGSLWKLPKLVAEDSDGWVIIGVGLDRVSGSGILVSTKDGKIYTLNEHFEYGIVSDGKIVTIDTGFYDDKLLGFGYFDTKEAAFHSINYEYLNLVYEPEWIMETVGYESWMELGMWPAYNMDTTKLPLKENTFLYDWEFSSGAMLLQLKGADGNDYYALINTQGENIIEPVIGTAVDTLGNGRFLVKRDDSYYVINERGQDINVFPDENSSKIYSAGVYNDGLSWVETSRGTKAYMDIDGKYVFGEKDVLIREKVVKVSSLSVSVEQIEKDKTENSMESTGETSPTDFEYKYGSVSQKSSDGQHSYIDAVIITKYIGEGDVVVIPAEIVGLPVMEIAESAFEGSYIKELYFSGNLSLIGKNAFANCVNLDTVVLPDNWMFLGDKCFAGCTSLAQLEVPADCVYSEEEVWNEELFVYEYIKGSPVGDNDSTVIVIRKEGE